MVWAQGQVKWAKMAWKHSTYGVTHKKSALPNQKIFVQVQTRRLAPSFWAFEQLSTTLRGGEATCDPVVLAWTTWFRLASKVLSEMTN